MVFYVLDHFKALFFELIINFSSKNKFLDFLIINNLKILFVMRLVTYAFEKERIDIKKFSEFLPDNYSPQVVDPDCLYVKIDRNADLFVIYDCLVFWNSNTDIENDVIKLAKKFLDKEEVELDFENFNFDYGDKDGVNYDAFTIRKDDNFHSKLAISFGLAQSAKLSYFEDKIEKAIIETEFIPKQLSKNGHISLSYKDISKKLGEIFFTRHLINLHCELLDKPRFFWNYSQYAPLYEETVQDLDLHSRVDVINKRIDIMQEIFDMLNTQLYSAASHRMEMIIIILISIEIIISLFTHFFN